MKQATLTIYRKSFFSFVKATMLLLSLTIPRLLTAQSLEGTITDAATAQPIQAVVISNLSSNNSTFSSNSGYYYIDAIAGDTVRFYTLGYKTFDLVVSEQHTSHSQQDIILLAQKFAIDEVVIGNNRSQYQLDSMERREIFGKKVDYKGAEVKADVMPGGFVVNGGITRLAEKASRKYRRLKKFQQRFKETEIELYAHSRYSDSLVTEITQLTDTALQEFKWRYPIEPNFGKNASDAELKLWILHNFNQDSEK